VIVSLVLRQFISKQDAKLIFINLGDGYKHSFLLAVPGET